MYVHNIYMNFCKLYALMPGPLHTYICTYIMLQSDAEIIVVLLCMYVLCITVTYYFPLHYFLPNTDNGASLSELAVFEETYALLNNTISDINDQLMECLIKYKFFTTEEENQIAAVTEAQGKLQLLLVKVSHSLKSDNTRGFYAMLKTMKEHGNKGTQILSDHIIKKLNISDDRLSRICSDVCQEQNEHVNPGVCVCVCVCVCVHACVCACMHVCVPHGNMKLVA